jgi:Ca-activated chloride channel family protein
MEIKPQFTYESVRHDKDNDLHLVVSLTAPKSDWQANRPPLCIIPVLDISGSMGGDKLAYAKQSILKLIENLTSDDYLGIVSFSTSARVDAKPVKMTPENKDAFKALVNRFKVEGGTNFSSGMLLGFETANAMDLPEATLTRVIMFTDGQPTHGVTDDKGLQTLIEKQAGRASMSAFGYGDDAKQELLQNLSTKGNGNYAYVRDPDGALAAFGKELGGLLSTYAQDLVIDVTPHNGHQIIEVLSDADVEEETTGEIQVKVPHVLSEETFNLVIAMKLAGTKQPGPRQVNAVDVKLRYQMLDADGKMVEKTAEAKAKVQFVKSGEEQKTPTKEVDEIVARAQLVKAQVSAESFARGGNFVAAAAAIADVNLGLNDRGHVGVAAVASHLNGMYLSQDSYRHTEGNRAGLRRAMSRGHGTSRLAVEDEVVLRSANYSVSNSAQEQMTSAFVGDGTPAPAVDLGGAVDLSVGASVIGASSLVIDPSAPALGANALIVTPPLPEKKLGKSRSKRW